MRITLDDMICIRCGCVTLDTLCRECRIAELERDRERKEETWAIRSTHGYIPDALLFDMFREHREHRE